MSRKVTQEQLDEAWADLYFIPRRLSEMRRQITALENRLAEAAEIVGRAQKQARGGQS